MASSLTPMDSLWTLKDDSGKEFLQEKQHHTVELCWAARDRRFPPPKKETFKKGYSITNLFSVLIILSMINENSFL